MKANKAHLRSLLARLHQLQELDRTRLAREIHDDISQKLTALSIELALLQRRLGESHPEFTKVGEILDLAGVINRSVRVLTNEIRPKILDEFGLIPAIKYECQRLEKSSVGKIHFSADCEDQAHMSDTASTELFRCFQEAMACILSASRNPEIAVKIETSPRRFSLQLTEKSSKSALFEDENRALALLNIQERVLRLGGKISVSAGTDSGTALKIEVALHKD